MLLQDEVLSAMNKSTKEWALDMDAQNVALVRRSAGSDNPRRGTDQVVGFSFYLASFFLFPPLFYLFFQLDSLYGHRESNTASAGPATASSQSRYLWKSGSSSSGSSSATGGGGGGANSRTGPGNKN